MRDHQGLSWLVGLASVFIVLAGLKAAEAITIPIMLALFITIISTPFIRMMTLRGIPSIVAVLIVLAVLIVFGGGLMMVVSQSVDLFMQRLPLYQERLQAALIGLIPLFERFDIHLSRDFLSKQINPAYVMGQLGAVLSMVSNLLTNVFLVVFIVIFLLMEEASFPRKLKAALPQADFTLSAASGFMDQVNKYLLIKTVISVATGVLVTLLLAWKGVDFPVLWGLVAMLMNFIPNVGSLIAAIPAVLLALVQLGVGDALVVALGYLLINTLMGSIIEPRYLGKGLGLSPLVVFLSLIVWGWLFGPVGMFLSIPLTMIAKIALEQYDGTRWIAIMLSDDVVDNASASAPSAPQSLTNVADNSQG